MFHCGATSIPIFIVFLLNLGSLFIPVDSYVVPEPTFEVLKPQGIRVSIPDESGLRFFAFQGNVNKKIALDQSGEISGEVYRKKDGKWTIEYKHIILADGDVIHYWINVQVDETMYKRGEQTWTVTFRTQETRSTPDELLLFNENFDTLNKSIWERDVKIPLNPDYEFCVYHNEHHTDVIQAANGILRIKPIILEDYYGENSTAYGTLMLSGCTSNVPAECTRKAVTYNILPPIISAKLSTRNSFYFRYGKIEIRAKFPEGDWLYPEIYLEPKFDNYGTGYSSGRVLLGLARGNDHLVNTTFGSIFDSRRLDFGFRIGTAKNVEARMVSKIQENGPRWTKDFHVYTTIWNSDGFQFLVDGEEVGKLRPETSGWMDSSNFDKMAPFDQEFYITIGVGVGGIRVFPDKTTSSGHSKPWRNVGAKAMLHFWHAKNQWLPSWRQRKGAKTALEIDYIRVWSF